MNIVVFGSTGGTGKEIVKQALHAGHHVRAAARTPSKMTVTHPNLQVFQADLYDLESVTKAVAGTDAVLSAVAHCYSALTI
ncbi:MAG: NAD(P)H-binding protein [Anaerolineaceae bacterium]|nr:NAD(P)H-binding protein [Anaerolineaceae bacterium]